MENQKIQLAKEEVLSAFEEAAESAECNLTNNCSTLKPIASRSDFYRDLAPIVANAVERALRRALG